MVTEPTTIRIATRGSQLALWQSESIATLLREASPDLHVELVVVRTTGDRILDVPLSRIGDRGLFTKEVDEAILSGNADLAVHSLKDVPTRLPDGLVLAATGRRADPRDVLIGPGGRTVTLDTLPAGARVGTSSLRRRSQLRHLRPDLEVVDLRGNLNTRLAKLDSGDYDAIILAAAGVHRLGWESRVSEYLAAERWLPAVGQGALAILCREDDPTVAGLLRSLHDSDTVACILAERSFLRSLEGGCQIPIGALATVRNDRLSLDGFVADLDGERLLRRSLEGAREEAEALGERLAEELRSRGADDILRAIREAETGPGIAPP